MEDLRTLIVRGPGPTKHVLLERYPDGLWIGTARKYGSPAHFPLVEVRWDIHKTNLLPGMLDEAIARNLAPRVYIERERGAGLLRLGVTISLRPGNEVWLRKLLLEQPTRLAMALPESDSVSLLTAGVLRNPGLQSFRKKFRETHYFCLHIHGRDWARTMELTRWYNQGLPLIPENDETTASS